MLWRHHWQKPQTITPHSAQWQESRKRWRGGGVTKAQHRKKRGKREGAEGERGKSSKKTAMEEGQRLVVKHTSHPHMSEIHSLYEWNPRRWRWKHADVGYCKWKLLSADSPGKIKHKIEKNSAPAKEEGQACHYEPIPAGVLNREGGPCWDQRLVCVMEVNDSAAKTNAARKCS